MGRIRRAIQALLGNGKPVLGIQEALKIFRSANGRFDGDATKGIPFAIKATAQVLGADVTYEQEAKDKMSGIQETVSEKIQEHADFTTSTNATIERLQKELENQTTLHEGEVGDLELQHQELEGCLAFFETN